VSHANSNAQQRMPGPEGEELLQVSKHVKVGIRKKCPTYRQYTQQGLAREVRGLHDELKHSTPKLLLFRLEADEFRKFETEGGVQSLRLTRSSWCHNFGILCERTTAAICVSEGSASCVDLRRGRHNTCLCPIVSALWIIPSSGTMTAASVAQVSRVRSACCRKALSGDRQLRAAGREQARSRCKKSIEEFVTHAPMQSLSCCAASISAKHENLKSQSLCVS
jgi:hypothetical protein